MPLDDNLNIQKANMVGLSMGGYLVQLVAIYHPERLITETLLMTTPNHMVVMNAFTACRKQGVSATQALDFLFKGELPEFMNNA